VIVSYQNCSCSRVSTQYLRLAFANQRLACSCDSISHDLPFVPLSNSVRDCPIVRGEPSSISGELLPFKPAHMSASACATRRKDENDSPRR
jgi:hypothetical protein